MLFCFIKWHPPYSTTLHVPYVRGHAMGKISFYKMASYAHPGDCCDPIHWWNLQSQPIVWEPLGLTVVLNLSCDQMAVEPQAQSLVELQVDQGPESDLPWEGEGDYNVQDVSSCLEQGKSSTAISENSTDQSLLPPGGKIITSHLHSTTLHNDPWSKAHTPGGILCAI